MKIKTSLSQLMTFFGQSASNDELPMPIRQFAAQCTILAAHTRRIDALLMELNKNQAELAQLVVVAVNKNGAAPPSTAIAPTVPQESDGGQGGGDDEDEATAKLLAQAQKDLEDDLATANKPTASITPLRKPSGEAPSGGAA